MIRRFLEFFFPIHTTLARRSQRRETMGRSRLAMEVLENRVVLSVSPGTATLTDGALVICGTDADNRIIVANTPNGIFVAADFLTTSQVFTASEVQSITVTGEAGNDILVALTLTQAVTMEGGDGTDVLFGGLGGDTLRGGEGNDFIYGRDGADQIFGDAGNDVLLGHDGADTIEGGDGDDRIFGSTGDDIIGGGAGNDSIWGNLGNDDLSGGADDDLLIGGDGNDSIFGNDGVDRIFGVGGDDRLDGGLGNDRVFGGAGTDAVLGQAGEDLLLGGQGVDVLSGGADADTLQGGSENDILIGGAAGDSLNGDAGDDVIIAGISSIDNDITALLAASASSGSAATYAARLAGIQADLAPDTTDDSETDTLFGSDGVDLYFTTGASDNVADRETSESIVGRELIAVNDTYDIGVGETLTTTVANGLLANDENPAAGEITIDLTPVSGPTNGTLTIAADGTFTYVHTGSAGDVDSFVYEISNADAATTQGTVTINVAAVANTFALSEHAAVNALVGTVAPQTALSGDVVYELVPGGSVPSALALAVDDHLTGDEDAPVMLIEYVDFQCPICKQYRGFVEQLKTEYSEELLVVTRHMPLSTIHPNATEAALFAEAAGQQGMFDEMGDLLFDGQDDWKDLADPTATFESYATTLGLNLTDVTDAVADAATSDRVNRDFLAATNDLGLTGTPSFFVNGESVSNGDVPTAADFSDRILDALTADSTAIALNRTTGDLRVLDRSQIDFETDPSFNFSVRATDGTNTETIPVTINLTDQVDETVIPTLPDGATVSTTASGLQFYDLELGDGATPVSSDSVRVGYTGYLPNGTIFDGNADATFSLGGVIDGFAEGIEGMQVGGTRRIFIPPNLGYGSGGNVGAGISGTDTIVFDVIFREIA